MLLTVLLGLLVLVLLCLATVYSHDFFFSVFLWLCGCGAVELYFVSFFQADFANEERAWGTPDALKTVLPRTCQTFGCVLHGGRVTRVAQSVNVCQPMVVQGFAPSFMQ